METITVEEFYQRIQSLGEEDLVLDVRSPGEFKEGHIRGARNHPHEEVAAIADELQNYKTVYVHCKMGGRAKIASQALKDASLDNIVCVGEGGMQKWVENGWPVEK